MWKRRNPEVPKAFGDGVAWVVEVAQGSEGAQAVKATVLNVAAPEAGEA